MLDLQHNIVSLLYAAHGTLSGYSERMLEQSFVTPVEQLAEAHGAIERTAALLERTMAITKRLGMILKSSRNHTKIPAEAGIDETWKTVKKIFCPSLRETRVEIIEHIPENFPAIQCDPRDLNEILHVLTEDAVQAMRGSQAMKPRKLIVRAELSLRGEETCALITVADTGPGMDNNILSRIFTPFFTTKEPGSSNGLGLFIAKRLAETNHGRISVSSFRSCGTTFSLEFGIALVKEQIPCLEAS